MCIRDRRRSGTRRRPSWPLLPPARRLPLARCAVPANRDPCPRSQCRGQGRSSGSRPSAGRRSC
eukprot:8604613-Lingulodinium_polyedra.AAC.1